MEVAKFVLTCIGSFISAAGFFLGFWKAYKKKVDDTISQTKQEADVKIRKAEEEAKAEIGMVRQGSIAKTERLEKRIGDLEHNVIDLQRDVSANLGQRLANIEGTMKGMNNILSQIQSFFITHTSPNG